MSSQGKKEGKPKRTASGRASSPIVLSDSSPTPESSFQSKRLPPSPKSPIGVSDGSPELVRVILPPPTKPAPQPKDKSNPRVGGVYAGPPAMGVKYMAPLTFQGQPAPSERLLGIQPYKYHDREYTDDVPDGPSLKGPASKIRENPYHHRATRPRVYPPKKRNAVDVSDINFDPDVVDSIIGGTRRSPKSPRSPIPESPPFIPPFRVPATPPPPPRISTPPALPRPVPIIPRVRTPPVASGPVPTRVRTPPSIPHPIPVIPKVRTPPSITRPRTSPTPAPPIRAVPQRIIGFRQFQEPGDSSSASATSGQPSAPTLSRSSSSSSSSASSHTEKLSSAPPSSSSSSSASSPAPPSSSSSSSQTSSSLRGASLPLIQTPVPSRESSRPLFSSPLRRSQPVNTFVPIGREVDSPREYTSSEGIPAGQPSPPRVETPSQQESSPDLSQPYIGTQSTEENPIPPYLQKGRVTPSQVATAIQNIAHREAEKNITEEEKRERFSKEAKAYHERRRAYEEKMRLIRHRQGVFTPSSESGSESPQMEVTYGNATSVLYGISPPRGNTPDKRS